MRVGVGTCGRVALNRCDGACVRCRSQRDYAENRKKANPLSVTHRAEHTTNRGGQVPAALDDAGISLGTTLFAVRSWWFDRVAVVKLVTWAAVVIGAAAASFGLAGCGSSTATVTDGEVVATEYRTLPPPTTTIPPTTTLPPEPGSILLGEATYVVVEGDYPFVVADRFGVNFDEFVALNGWTTDKGVVPEWPVPGTTIRIPAGARVPEGPSVLVPVPTTAPDPAISVAVGAGDPASGDPATGTSIATSAAAGNGAGCGTYTVAAGDFPTRVATKLNTTVEALASANRKTAGYDAFYVGLKINVPC